MRQCGMAQTPTWAATWLSCLACWLSSPMKRWGHTFSLTLNCGYSVMSLCYAGCALLSCGVMYCLVWLWGFLLAVLRVWLCIRCTVANGRSRSKHVAATQPPFAKSETCGAWQGRCIEKRPVMLRFGDLYPFDRLCCQHIALIVTHASLPSDLHSIHWS